MADLDNAAARVLAFIRGARSVDQGRPTAEGCAKILGLRDDDLAGVMDHASRLIKMVASIPGQVARVEPENHELYLKHYPQIESLRHEFGSLHQSMGDTLRHINPDTGEWCLEICASVLNRDPYRSPAIPEETALQLHEDVLRLLDEVKDSDDIPDYTKRWLIERLQDLADKLDPRRFYSSSDVELSRNALVGGIQGKRERLSDLSKSPLLHRLVTFVVALVSRE